MHGALFTKDTLEGWLHGSKIEKRLVDIEDDQGKSGHVITLLFVTPNLESVSLSVLEPAANVALPQPSVTAMFHNPPRIAARFRAGMCSLTHQRHDWDPIRTKHYGQRSHGRTNRPDT